jgi:hypothetical protein
MCRAAWVTSAAFRAAADERRVHEPQAGLEPSVHGSNVVGQAGGFPEQLGLGRAVVEPP